MIASMLVLTAAASFARSLAFGFVYDDTWIVQHNPSIMGWRSLLTLWHHPYWMDQDGAQAGLYRPAHTAVLAIIGNAGGWWPLWFHLYAILLHAGITFLAWRMLARGVRRWPAALAALWFAVHPVHVEAVANISNTSELLVALWTLLLYFLFADVRERLVSWRQALLAASLFLLALLSKESGSMSLAIAVIAAIAWQPRREGTVNPSANETPLWALLLTLGRRWFRVAIAGAVSLAIVIISRSMVLGSSVTGASMAAVGIENMSALERAWSMFSLGPLIFGLLGWPHIQNPYYGPSSFPTGLHLALAASVTIVVLVLAIAGAIRLARRDARPLAAIAWTLLAFLPASNLLVATGQILAERTLYVPSVGIAMLLAWGMDRLAIALARSWGMWRVRGETGRVLTAISGVAIVVVCVRFGVLAQRATGAWRSHRAVIEQMIAADPGGYRGHYLLALDLRRGKAADSTAREFANAYRLYARDPQLNFDYARFLLEWQQPAEAALVTRALMDDSRMRNDADAIRIYLEARGRAYGADSVLVAASRLYRRRPDPTSALYLGLAHEARGERAAALLAYRDGLRIAPNDSTLVARTAELESKVF